MSDWIRPQNADVCALLPAVEGARVAVLADSPAIAELLAQEGLQPVLVASASGEEARRLPLASASVDHVLLPDWGAGWALLPAREIGRVLRPGGALVVGLACAGVLSQRPGPAGGMPRPPGAAQASGPGLADCQRWLEQGGFEVATRLGAYRPTPAAQDFIVPIDHPGAVHHFLDRLLVLPYRWGAVLRRYCGMLVTLGLPDRVFGRVLILARKV